MQHFFVTPDQVGEDTISITGSDVNHMKQVLRMKPGEEVSVSDGNNTRYLCTLKDFVEDASGEACALLTITSSAPLDSELPVKIYLFQALPKSDKMDTIVQKAVELGACGVIPVRTRRCVARLDEKKAAKKQARWQEIAKAAAKQAGRGLIPEVMEPLDFAQALREAKDLGVVLFPYELAEGMERTRAVLEAIRPGQSVGIFIGPEGGFEKEEAEEAVKMGAKEITLGKRILRTETAGAAVLSILMYLLES